MERLGIIGAAWKRITTRGLERFQVTEAAQAEELPRLKEALGVDEMVYLSTCNRVEILFCREFSDGQPSLLELRRRAFRQLTGADPEAGEDARSLKVWMGEGALEHLLMVASGLDSAQLGEREIRGQLRQAQRRADELGLSGPMLDWVVERALQLARRVEKETELAAGRVSLAGIGFEAVERHLVERQRAERQRAERPSAVAVVGVSPMTERCGAWLRDRDVPCLVVNRSEERGRDLASRLGAPFARLDHFRRRPWACAFGLASRIGAVITATGAGEPVFGRAELKRLVRAAGAPPLLVDFGVPGDVDARAARKVGAPHLDMEAINQAAEASRSRRQDELADARALIDDALVELRREAAERALSPVMKQIAGRYRQTAEEATARLFRRQLRHLSEEEREVVENFALGLAKRFAHVPAVGLRALVGEHGLDVADTFLAASDERSWGLRPGEVGTIRDGGEGGGRRRRKDAS